MSNLSNREKKEVVRVRDGDDCKGCDELIDFSLPPNDPDSASLDHRIPRAAGGSNGLKNLQLMHLRCNQEKAAIHDGVDYETVSVSKARRPENVPVEWFPDKVA